MGYPLLAEADVKTWWNKWLQDVESAESAADVEIPEAPEPTWSQEWGGEYKWESIGNKIAGELEETYLAAESDAEFEALASVQVHCGLPRDIALADTGFWAWLAVGPCKRLVRWRYPPTRRKPIPDIKNFYTSNGRETLLCRLWLRAEMACDGTRADPYELAYYGDVDLWRSHVLRQMFAEHKPILAAFLQFQYPDGPDGQPRLRGKNQSEVRELAKFLRRRFANVEVSILDEEGANSFIASEWLKAQESLENA